MASAQEIVVRYTADIGQLQTQSTEAVKTVEKTAKKANSAVTVAAKKTQDSLAKTTAQGAEKTKSGFMAIGQAVSLLTPALGEAGGKMAMFTSSGIMGMAVMTESIKLMAEAWKATLVAGIAAAGAALGYWLSTMTDATAEIEKQKKALYGLSAARQRDADILTEYNKLTEDGAKRLRLAETAAKLFGTQQEALSVRADILKAKTVSATIAREDLTEAEKDGLAQRERDKASLAGLTSAHQRLIDEFKEYRNSLGAVGPGIAEYKKQVTESEERIKRFEKALEDKAQALDDTGVRIRSLTKDIEGYKAELGSFPNIALPTLPPETAPDIAPVPGFATADEMIFGGDPEKGLGAIEKIAKGNTAALEESTDAVYDFGREWLGLGSPINAIKNTVAGTFQTISGGLSAAIVEVALFGEGFQEIMSSVFASVAQMFINLVMEMMLTWVSAKITEMITGNIAAYSSIPFIGLALGLAGAAAAIAASKALASSEGGAAFADGGIVTGPMLALVGEGGQDELIAPRSDFEKAMKGGGGEHGHDIYMDGRKVGETVMKTLPTQVKRRGIKGF